MMSWPSGPVALWLVTVICIKSHSYWVLITSRDSSVASEELSVASSRRCLAAGHHEAPKHSSRTVWTLIALMRAGHLSGRQM